MYYLGSDKDRGINCKKKKQRAHKKCQKKGRKEDNCLQQKIASGSIERESKLRLKKIIGYSKRSANWTIGLEKDLKGACAPATVHTGEW